MSLERYLRRLMWAGMAPLLALALALLVVRLYQLEQGLTRNGRAAVADVLRDIEQEMALRRAGLELLAASPLMDEARPSVDLHRQLKAFSTQFGGEVLEIGPGQQVLLHTAIALGDKLPAAPEPRGLSAVEAVEATAEPAVGDMFIGPVVGRPLVVVAVPVQRPGQPMRVLLTTVEVGRMQKTLDQLSLAPGWSMQLRDSGQRLMASRGAHAPPTEAAAPPPWSLQFVQRSASAPWTLSLTVSPQARFGPTLLSGAFLLAGILWAGGLAYAGSRLAARRLARGLQTLADPAPAPAALTTSQALAQAQTSLHLAAARTQAIIEYAADAIITCDERLLVRSANPAAMRMWKADADQLVGSNLERWMPQRHRHRLGPWLQPTKQATPAPTAQDLRRLMKLARSDGQELTVEAQGSRVAAGEASFYVVVLRDMSAQIETRRALVRSTSDLRSLIGRMNTLQEEERARISRDLHDDLQQRLASMDFTLAALSKAARGGGAPVAVLIDAARGAAHDAIAATRRIVRDLRPQVLEDLGLGAAMEAMVRSFGESTALACEIRVTGDHEPAPDTATCLYRVTQEALNNVRKHAQARSVQVDLDLSSPDQATLLIEDDGVGLRNDGAGLPGGLGLLGMAERLRAVGGVLAVSPAARGGTLVRATAPLRPQAAQMAQMAQTQAAPH